MILFDNTHLIFVTAISLDIHKGDSVFITTTPMGQL